MPKTIKRYFCILGCDESVCSKAMAKIMNRMKPTLCLKAMLKSIAIKLMAII
jgi:hypothetical protein